MDYKKFKEIKEKYGDCGSWAIWAEEGNKPKSNVGDISIFDTSRNPSLIQNLKPEFVFVGLNFSKIKANTSRLNSLKIFQKTKRLQFISKANGLIYAVGHICLALSILARPSN